MFRPFKKRAQTPIEERPYGTIYLIFSGLLALTTFWAVFDMLYSRAPWKNYQREFNRLETEKLKAQLEEAETRFRQEKGDEYVRLQAELKKALAALKSPEYQKLKRDSLVAERRVEDARREFRFARSELDELYYDFKKAEHEGHTATAQKLKPHVDEGQKQVDALKAKWDQAELELKGIITKIQAYESHIDSLKNQLKSMTVAMDGLRERLAKVRERKLKVEQVVLQAFEKGNWDNWIDRVDRCHTCHVATTKPGFEQEKHPFRTHPDRDVYLALHPTEKFGCTPCHEGQGQALQAKYAHGFVKHVEHPLLRDGFLETGCDKCHSEQFKVEQAPVLTKGKRMLFDLGCYGCHEIKGYETAEKTGPPLNRLPFKTRPEWVFRWLKGPKRWLPHGRMPDPLFSDEEAEAVTAFLWNIGKQETEFKLEPVQVTGSAARGQALFESIGCKGCHIVGDEDRQIRKREIPYDLAPELTKIGSKTNPQWLYDWIRNPKHYNPATRMPRLRLTDVEASDLVAYLMTLKSPEPMGDGVSLDLQSPGKIKEGERIVRNFGCHGCHEIRGMEKESKVSVSLSAFGGKTVEELFFGDALAKGIVKHQTWEDWTVGKLMYSRVYATEVIIQKMPNFGLSREDATVLAAYLKALDGREFGKRYLKPMTDLDQAIAAGDRLVRKYNCVGCHIIRDEGGEIRSVVAASLVRQGMSAEDAPGFSPPPLASEGARVQEKWLFDFLKDPSRVKIRPWLKVRMPTFDFSDEEATALIKYFLALDRQKLEFRDYTTFKPDPKYVAAGGVLAGPEKLQCQSCHTFGGGAVADVTSLAPNLELVPQRLKPEWVLRWLEDPQKIQPGTRMPTYFPDLQSPEPQILNGDAREQIRALRDYLFSLKPSHKEEFR